MDHQGPGWLSDFNDQIREIRAIGDSTIRTERYVELYEHHIQLVDPNEFPMLWSDLKAGLADSFFGRVVGQPQTNEEMAVSELSDVITFHRQRGDVIAAAVYETMLGERYIRTSLGTPSGKIEAARSYLKRAAHDLDPARRPANSDMPRERANEWLAVAELSLARLALIEKGDDPLAARSDAISALERLVAERRFDSGVLADAYRMLGLLLIRRGIDYENFSDEVKTGVEHLERSLTFIDPADTEKRIGANIELQSSYVRDGDHTKARTTFNALTELYNRVLTENLDLGARLSGLDNYSAMHTVEAHRLISQGRLEEAFEHIELGKALISTEARAMLDLETYGLPAEVLKADPEAKPLLKHFVKAHREMTGLRSSATEYRDDEASRRVMEAVTGSMHELELRGHFAPADFDSSFIAEFTNHHSLVVPYVTLFGGGCFVVPRGAASITNDHFIPLPNLTDRMILREIVWDEEKHRGYLEIFDSDRSQSVDFQGLIERTSDSLGNELMYPVHKRLTDFGVEPKSHVVISPQGWLTGLPLHTGSWSEGGNRTFFMSKWIVSYTPNLRLLQSAQRARSAESVRETIFAIADPTGDLPFADTEVAEACRHFGVGKFVSPSQATLESVLGVIDGPERHGYLHFACHGISDANPVLNRLVLAEEDFLEAGHIYLRDMRQIRLATLSACETAALTVHTPDEYPGFVGAMLATGVAGVLVTLWSIPDLSTSIIFEQFYRRHLIEGKAPAIALHEAANYLRTATASELSLAQRWREHGERTADPVAAKEASYYDANPTDVPYPDPDAWGGLVLYGL